MKKLYHATEGDNAFQILTYGFDLKKINVRFINGYAISFMNNIHRLYSYFGKNIENLSILEVDFFGEIFESTEININAINAIDYTNKAIKNGIDAVHLNNGLVYVYNLQKIKNIKLL